MDEDEEARLMADYEPVLVAEDRLMLHQIVEDEILLALPMIPRCSACENSGPASAETSLEPVEKPGPLAALKNLSLKGVTPARRK
ncbi:MAG: YceD family protein [Panacagrimonas sp.]